MKKAYVLFSIVVAIAVLFAVSEVRGEDYPLQPLTAPRTCNLTYAKIVAGPDSNGQPNAVFPRPVTCPSADCPGSDLWIPPLIGQFLIWEYQFSYIGLNPSLALLSVASDIEIAQTLPTAIPSVAGAGDSSTKLGANMWESRILRFTANAVTYKAAYFTPTGLTPRVATAGYKAGSTSEFCKLAGAGKTSLEQNQAVPYQQSFIMPGCTVSYNVASNGKVIPGSMQIVAGDSCTVNETLTPLMIDGIDTVFVGAVQFTQPGSCSFCFTNTSGGKTCSTCTTCCINNATGVCVQKSSLSSPATQCRSGTY